MKKLYSLCLVCCFAGILQAQTKIRYSYDASGNRVKREIVLSRVQNRALADPENEKPLSEKFAGQTVRFYPNPTKGQITIAISGNTENLSGDMKIFTMNGKCIATRKIVSSKVSFDLSDQPAGNYILKMTLSGKSATWKIIKE
ncbi:T9SS type A sorting domain-containing protein [Coprobacter fastidiosus]|jgi:hemagglutinin|uniref:T9SS type A sorting domain-containing protein n=1 Tax=Coprobacter fastidiosus TaxID=1099853 RepID=UPI001D875C02|nr:T9SS type A sorting domain-containing protein [Coprobacter fastidiosus]HJF43245.1 T9SS type A sorting domain-containing protein [Coprobacter fastidiosus]